MSGILCVVANCNSSAPAVSASSMSYTTAGTYTWLATFTGTVSVLTVGGGAGAGTTIGGCCPQGGNGAGGGALAYANNISVTVFFFEPSSILYEPI